MSTDHNEPRDWSGWVVFAAAVMLTIAAVGIIQGLSPARSGGAGSPSWPSS